MDIGLYFGSFNPIHTGHLIIAQHFLNQTGLKQVWFVVTPQNPFKPSSTLLNEYHRLHLVRLGIGDNPGLRVSDAEFHLPKPSYTSVTLAYLEELLKRDWALAQREKRSIAVFAIDIDALDLYNTTFGRAAGDSTIRRVAHVVSGCLRRSSDVTARIDGGSLIAFAPGLTTEQALRIGQLMAERVRELRIHHPRSAILRYISVSVGVCAAVPESADSPAGLVEKSQKQLQIAKKSGRNQAA